MYKDSMFQELQDVKRSLYRSCEPSLHEIIVKKQSTLQMARQKTKEKSG